MNRLKSQRLADLENKTAELERKLSDARTSLERELAQSPYGRDADFGQIQEERHCAVEDAGREDVAGEYETGAASVFYVAPLPTADYDAAYSGGQVHSPLDRTEVLLSHGRHSANHHGLSRGRKIAIGTAAAAVLITILVVAVFSGGASWPSSVATVQGEITQACQNPDVKSEPGQLNFACATATRQILWVFALMTSANDPRFADRKTGRVGLEPITPAQGGEVAWSLNLHHPYNPSSPIDSLEVAARAINNIIGGATVIGADGSPAVQSGLESSPGNCARYTGSSAVTARDGFPGLCAQPVTSAAGQADLVADVFKKWLVGATPQAAQDAAVLFENANNPGDPRVQAILRQLPISKSPA
jgi:hypothetical protein